MALGITVREALQLPELVNVTVEGGARGLDRVIRAVNVMEVPDISSYVESGELLLTTTYPIHSDQDTLNRLVPMLAERELAGLAIKPARYLDEIPREMVEQADANDFPLLRLPSDASFTRLLNPILSEILHRQAALLRRSESVHESLTSLVLQGAGLDALARTVSSLVALPVAVLDANFRILAHSESQRDPDDPFLAFLEKVQAEEFYPSSGAPVQRSLWMGSKLSTVLIHPVQVGTEVCGYICVWERDGEFNDRDVACVEQAAIVTALEFQKQRAIRETERRFWDDFVRDLLSGRVSCKEEALARGAIYGHDLNVPRVLLLLRRQGQVGDGMSLDEQVRDRLRLERAVQSAVAGPAGRYLLGHLGDVSALLLAPSHPTEEAAREDALRVAAGILDELKSDRFVKEQVVRVGIARLRRAVTDWPEAYREAQEALQIGSHLGLPNTVTHYDDLGIYRVLTRVQDDDELERFCRDTLGALVTYDAKHKTNLLETLCAVIEANGNAHQAAATMFVHYNTMRYRLQRIAEIQGLRIDSIEQMMQADVAIKAHRLLQVRRSSQVRPEAVP